MCPPKMHKACIYNTGALHLNTKSACLYMCHYGNMEKGLIAEMGMHLFSFLLHSDLYVCLYIEPLPSGFPAASSDKLHADVNAAIVSRCATSCRLPGPHPSDVLMIWHTWSKALFVSWCAFCFSWAPTCTGIDLAGFHSHCWWMQISGVKMRRKRLNISSVPTNGLSLKCRLWLLRFCKPIQKTRYIQSQRGCLPAVLLDVFGDVSTDSRAASFLGLWGKSASLWFILSAVP